MDQAIGPDQPVSNVPDKPTGTFGTSVSQQCEDGEGVPCAIGVPDSFADARPIAGLHS